jgi:hypothetical protein
MDHRKGWGVNHRRSIVNPHDQDNLLEGVLREGKADKVGCSKHRGALQDSGHSLVDSCG